MKDTRFKELLNLHLDQRLSAEEAEELEAELRANPARLKALRDYEAMQSACAALFARSASCAPSSAALRRALMRAESRIEHPRSIRDGWGWPVWGLTGGLAACVALVVARLSHPGVGIAKESPEASAPVQAGMVTVATAAAPTPSPAAPAATRPTLPSQLTFAALGLSAHGRNADAASRWILREEEPAVYATIEQANAASEAMQAWASTVPQAAPRHFGGRPINALGQSAVGAYQVESVAYRFER
jgi:hypothetical protein